MTCAAYLRNTALTLCRTVCRLIRSLLSVVSLDTSDLSGMELTILIAGLRTSTAKEDAS